MKNIIIALISVIIIIIILSIIKYLTGWDTNFISGWISCIIWIKILKIKL